MTMSVRPSLLATSSVQSTRPSAAERIDSLRQQVSATLGMASSAQPTGAAGRTQLTPDWTSISEEGRAALQVTVGEGNDIIAGQAHERSFGFSRNEIIEQNARALLAQANSATQQVLQLFK